MISATQVVNQIRRSLLTRFFRYVVMSAVLAALVVRHEDYGDSHTNFLTAFVLAVIFAVIVVYAGKYVPVTSKHENLLNKYGHVYLAEAEKAMSKYGMDRMLSTCWFEIYADNFCERESAATGA